MRLYRAGCDKHLGNIFENQQAGKTNMTHAIFDKRISAEQFPAIQ
jgi:hypothetical protein